MHVFGNMADMERIMDIAEEYGLKVIEDAAEAFGTRYLMGRYRGKYAGTIGDFGAFSFNGNKIITTGGGGAVVAKDPAQLEHMKYLSTQAKDDPLFYVHNEVGCNYRMTNVWAAVGAAQMEELPEFIERKKKNYEHYKTLLRDCGFGRLLGFREGTDSNKWFYSFLLYENRMTVKDVIEKLSERNIQSRSIWGLVHEQTPYRSETAYCITEAGNYQDRIINLPCSTQMTSDDVERVVHELEGLT